jgi:hypothetical protein
MTVLVTCRQLTLKGNPRIVAEVGTRDVVVLVRRELTVVT